MSFITVTRKITNTDDHAVLENKEIRVDKVAKWLRQWTARK